MTSKQAIELYKTNWWENKDPKVIAEFQLNEKLLCMPFDKFHEAVEKALGRPVYTHEFGLCLDDLKRELHGDKEPPTIEEIIKMIPESKQILIIGE